MNNNEPFSYSTLKITLFILLTLVILAGRVEHVQAQQSQWTSNGNNINNTNQGNVGIGTNNPSYRLHVTGDNTGAGGYPIIKLQNSQANGHAWWLYSGALGVPGAFGLYDETAGSYRLFLDGGGSIGIGTTNPTAYGAGRLVVQGAGGADYTGADFVVQNSSAPSKALRLWYDNTNDVGRITAVNYATSFRNLSLNGEANSGNVGVGTIAPAGKLHVVANTSPSITGTTPNGTLVVDSGNASLTTGVTNTNTYGWMQMRSSTLSGNTYPLSLQPLGGKVGIGTSAPTTTLDVAGDLNASGTITGGTIIARYQDVAEWVPSTQKLEAGTVVVLDSEMTNHVRASSKPYDTRVAGVVSARPGITLGEGGAGKLLVATTGRVKVKVDATRSPVRVGDLLVTGEEEGAAIKSEPLDIGGAQIHRPGTIIGKALEPLAKGRGEILVLLSLQ
jgi:hypothetical protein